MNTGFAGAVCCDGVVELFCRLLSRAGCLTADVPEPRVLPTL